MISLACVAGGSEYPSELRSLRSREKPLRSREEFYSRLRRSRKFSRGRSLRGNSGFAAKGFARAPTPASYAGYDFPCQIYFLYVVQRQKIRIKVKRGLYLAIAGTGGL